MVQSTKITMAHTSSDAAVHTGRSAGRGKKRPGKRQDFSKGARSQENHVKRALKNSGLLKIIIVMFDCCLVVIVMSSLITSYTSRFHMIPPRGMGMMYL